MAGDEDSSLFPNMAQKLAAPKKMSEMERNKRAAEEKQKKEEALQAETLREFEEAFGVAPPSRQSEFQSRYPPSGPGHGGSGFRRGPPGASFYDEPPPGPRRSGPGSLEGLAAPPISIQERKRRRAMEEDEAARARESDGYATGSKAGHDTPNRRKERDTVTAPKNSVRLSNLPPSITERQIKNLLRGHLQVFSIDITEQPNVHGVGRRSMTAVVVLETGTTTTAIEKATSVLKDKYLGCGYSLIISRYLPSDVLHQGMPDDSFVPVDTPFGARPMKQNFSNSTMGNLSRAPPPSDFAPPGSYEAGIPPGNVFHAPAEAVVQVRVPKDLQVTQLIHLMASWYHSQEDMNLALEKESQLMAAPQVQNNPLFSFLYDCTGDAGVYFRWLLWNPQGLGALSGHKRVNSTPVRIHDDVPIDWIPPTLHMPFSDVTEISEILEHLDFDSDDECDDDMPGYREEDPIPGDEDMLGPLRRARLSRMLACLPPSRAFLERRHVAPIQNFVMKHAGRGALEIVDIIQMNINRPFNASGFTIAVPPPGDSDEDDDEFMHQDLPTNGDESSHQDSSTTITAQTYNPATRTPAPPDILTDAKLVSLDIVTAVCVASYQSATPGSHRYRKLFPEAFLEAGVIVGLAETPTEYGWGMIKTDRWERRIRAVFKVWEECNCFTMDEIQSFRRIFDGVIAGRHKKAAEEKNESGDQAALAKPIFKSVEDVMAEREAAELGATGEVDDLNSEDSEDDDHDREIDGVPIDLTRLRIAKAVDGALTWQLFDSSDEKLEAIYRPIFEEQRTAVHEADEVLVDAPATDDTAAVVPPQPKVAEAKKVTEAVSSPAPKEKKDIDMFADDDSE